MKGTANKASSFLTKYAMVIALVIVFVLFAYLTDWRLLYPQNMSNLMLQNGYVLVMACGMLLCILTGGNIDLSIGSVICLVGVINMGMSILGIGDSWQYVVKGGVLLVAVIFDVVTSRKSGK